MSVSVRVRLCTRPRFRLQWRPPRCRLSTTSDLGEPAAVTPYGRRRDHSVLGYSKDGTWRGVVVDNSKTTLDSKARFGLSDPLAGLLGRAFTSALMLNAFQKGESRVRVNGYNEHGDVQVVVAEANALGETRGFVVVRDGAQGSVDSHAISRFGSQGILRVSTLLYAHAKEVFSTIQLQASAEGIGSRDLQHYMEQSEQAPAVANLTTDVSTMFSGGYMLQPLAGAPATALSRMKERLQHLPSLTAYVSQGGTPLDILKELIPDLVLDQVKRTPIDLFCRCSLDSFLVTLQKLGAEEIRDMQRQGHNKLSCQYCNKQYTLEQEHFDQVLQRLDLGST